VNLVLQTARTFVIGVLVLAALTLLPAWTLDYWQAWVFIVVFNTAANAIGVYLTLNDPALLERRKKGGPTAEQRPAQRIFISIGILGFLGSMVVSSLDHRFTWSSPPQWIPLAGDALVALGFLIDLLVFRENSYGGSSIEVTADQKVISTGPYAIARHPMYVGVLIMALGTPLALGSWWGLLLVLLTVPVLVLRILDEEKLLEQDLPGYTAYEHKVRYRLVPFFW
jgi:protein-S-isoprenylcysteine O-methyltransferase Ste14